MSFDVDPFSVRCCQHWHEKEGRPQNWEIREGSILDDQFISHLGTFDIVYSWGVLHHTGKMWDAIRNSARLTNPGGLYYIAIYNKVEGKMGSHFWLRIKKLYNRFPCIGKWGLEWTYMLLYFGKRLVQFKNPLKEIKNYKSMRGMSWRRDITDWLGGYPYEFATADEICEFMKEKFPDFKLINIQKTAGTGNNWFLFQRNS